jgi:hypothetical protein
MDKARRSAPRFLIRRSLVLGEAGGGTPLTCSNACSPAWTTYFSIAAPGGVAVLLRRDAVARVDVPHRLHVAALRVLGFSRKPSNAARPDAGRMADRVPTGCMASHPGVWVGRERQCRQVPVLARARLGQVPVLARARLGQVPVLARARLGQVPVLARARLGQVPAVLARARRRGRSLRPVPTRTALNRPTPRPRPAWHAWRAASVSPLRYPHSARSCRWPGHG